MTTTAGFPGVVDYMPDQVELNRQQSRVINNLLRGKTNNTGTVTLAASVTSTTVTLAKGQMGNNTVIVLMPTTANAATEYAAGTWYITKSISASTFTITHVNNAQIDRTFLYALIG